MHQLQSLRDYNFPSSKLARATPSSRNQLDKSTAIAQDAHWHTSRRANLLGRLHRAGTNWTSQLQSPKMLTGTLPVEQTCLKQIFILNTLAKQRHGGRSVGQASCSENFINTFSNTKKYHQTIQLSHKYLQIDFFFQKCVRAGRPFFKNSSCSFKATRFSVFCSLETM